MEAATMKSDGERMRSAATALQHAQKRLVPMADDPIQELWNIRQFLREQRHEVDYSPPQLWAPLPGPQTDAITTR